MRDGQFDPVLLIADGLDCEVVSMKMKRMIFIRSVDPAPSHQPACRVNEPFRIGDDLPLMTQASNSGFGGMDFASPSWSQWPRTNMRSGIVLATGGSTINAPESWLSIPVRLSSEAPVVVPQ